MSNISNATVIPFVTGEGAADTPDEKSLGERKDFAETELQIV